MKNQHRKIMETRTGLQFGVPGSQFAYFFTATATPSRMGKKVVNKSCEL
jgi:hypothetical protein